jgi:hypothetical protein
MRIDLQTRVSRAAVQVDLAAARRYGIKPGDVRRAAAAWTF